MGQLEPDHIEKKIKSESYHVFPDTTVTVCCLTLQNDYCVIGHSACVLSCDFDESIGRDVARENAKEKIWALEGYLLKDKLMFGG